MSKPVLFDAAGKPLPLLGQAARAVTSSNFDGWSNSVTGYGTDRDKTQYTRYFGVDWLSDAELSSLFHGDAIAQRMVCARPDEMLREGYVVDTKDDGLNLDLRDRGEELDILGKVNEGMRWGRLFGAGAVLLGCDDGRSAAKPLVPEKANDLSYLYVLDKRYIQPLTYYSTPGHPKLGKPETYFVTQPSTYAVQTEPVSIVHETRLVMFGGAPTGLLEREVNQSFDRSVLQAAFDALRSFNTGYKSVEVLLTDGFQAVFKMAGLKEAIAADDFGDIAKRFAAIDRARSVIRAMVVDAGTGNEGEAAEDFTRSNITLAGVPDALDKLILLLAASVKTPVTILMGQSPAGMNATGVSDFRWWYDDLASDQTLRLAPKLRRIYRVMLATKRYASVAKGKQVTITFPPLWTMTPLEAAQTRVQVLTGDNLLVQMQAVQPEKVALTRCQPDGAQRELVFTPEERKQYEDALKAEQELMVEQAGKPEEPPAPPGGGFGGGFGGGGGGPAPPPKAAELS